MSYASPFAQRRMRARLRAVGLCCDCKQMVDSERSRIRCKRCLERLRVASRRYREAHYTDVVQRHRVNTSARRRKRIAAGLCRDCGRPRDGQRRKGHTVRCMRCARSRAFSKWRRVVQQTFGSVHDAPLVEMLALKRALQVSS